MNYEFYSDLGVYDDYYSNNTKQLDLLSPYEAYLSGNIFKSQYIPYDNKKIVKVNINSEQEEMIFNISEMAFMMHDLNLYLDIYPNNREALSKFNEYRNKTDELIKNYERKYGPLTVNTTNTSQSFDWISKWPWVI